jgi:hypothetical protein
MKLRPNETDLIGSWFVTGKAVDSDAIARRIDLLVREHLRRLGSDSSGWDTLLEDPADGRLWELTYPQSDSAGGGPPRLTCVDRETARRKYINLRGIV